MKNILLVLLFITATLTLFAAEPAVKIYLNDGSIKEYNLEDIEDFSFIDNSNLYVMKIHYDAAKVAYYPIEIIEKVKFEKDEADKRVMNVYISSFPKTYSIASIDSVVFIIDKYQPLTICDQVWMLKNLNEDTYRNGDTIKIINSNNEWIAIGKNREGAYCYLDFNSQNGDVFGKLYNWYAVNDSRGLAPDGWHMPTDEEWKELEMCLGMSKEEVDKISNRGVNQGPFLAGKENLWKDGALKSNMMLNVSGFTAVPGGFAYYNGGFYGRRLNALWWTSTVDYDNNGYMRSIDYDKVKIFRGSMIGRMGLSVRCVKDD